MEQIQSVVSCKKIALEQLEETTGKKRRRTALAVKEGYCVMFNTGLSVCFSADEVAEYYFYEEAELRRPFETIMVCILFRRLLTAVLPFVVYTKRTEMQVRRRVMEMDFSDLEPVWMQYQEEALCQLMKYLHREQYVDDARYVQSYLRIHLEKATSKRSLEMELSKRGIDQSLIDEALSEVELDETESARRLLCKKFPNMTGNCSQKERARIYRYLAGKGFSGETIRSVMRRYGEEDGVC